MAALQLNGLSKSCDGSTSSVDDIDLVLQPGECIVVIGPPGSGKSTLLRLIAGLERPDRGEVRIGGKRVNTMAPRRRGVALLLPGAVQRPAASVLEQLALWLRPPRRWPHRPPSPGERERAAIGRFFARQGALLLCDEPLSQLDAPLRAELCHEIQQLRRQRGSSLVYVAQDEAEATALADRIGVMQGGRLVQLGSPAAVMHQPATLFAASFFGALPMNLVSCRVADGYAAVGPLRIALPYRLSGCVGEHTLGLRPEHLTLEPQPGVDVTMPATLIGHEAWGDQPLVRARVGNAELRACAGGPVAAPVGSTIELHLHPNRLHLFDRKSGMALGHGAGAAWQGG